MLAKAKRVVKAPVKRALSRSLGLVSLSICLMCLLSSCSKLQPAPFHLHQPPAHQENLQTIHEELQSTKEPVDIVKQPAHIVDQSLPSIHSKPIDSHLSDIHGDLSALPTAKQPILVGRHRLVDPRSQVGPRIIQELGPVLTDALLSSGWFQLQGGVDSTLNNQGVYVEAALIEVKSEQKIGGVDAQLLELGPKGLFRDDRARLKLCAMEPQARQNQLNQKDALQCVQVSKRFLSRQMLDKTYQYVNLDQRAAGIRSLPGDPMQRLLAETIDAAVVQLIVDGVIENRWALKHALDEQHPLMAKYADPLKYVLWKQAQLEKRGKITHANMTPSQKSSLAHYRPLGAKPVTTSADNPQPQAKGEAESHRHPHGHDHHQNGHTHHATTITINQDQQQSKQNTQHVNTNTDAKAKSPKVSQPSKPAKKKPSQDEWVGGFSVRQAAALNRRMKREMIAKKTKKRTQSMTLNRPRADNAPRKKERAPFTVQLFADTTDGALERFLHQFPKLSGSVVQHRYRALGEQWVTVVYGDFADKESARNAIQQLPDSVRALSPWVRAVR